MAKRAGYLQFDLIGKSFPGVRALDEVNFSVAAGSVHALMGENGAGKSTILKILSGAQQPDSGKIIIDGAPVRFLNAAQAISSGVAVIYQELNLVPNLSVAENLFIGHLPRRLGWIDRRTLLRRASVLLQMLGETEVDPRALVSSLPIAQRQMIEIGKALSHDARVIAFDEPTSSLSAREVDRLFGVIRQLRDRGRAVLYVSHRMDEIDALCDAATVLRDGKHVATFDPLAEVSRDTLVQKMVGRTITDVFRYTSRPAGEPLLEVNELKGKGLTAPATFTVRAGEIVGFFGVIGAGRSELMRLIYGAENATDGEIRIAGKLLKAATPRRSIDRGMIFCSEDRKKDGIIPQRSVQENINLSARRSFSPLRCWISGPREHDNAVRGRAALGVRAASLAMPIAKLSGGNQQKALLARWLNAGVRIALFDEPTRGIDIGAKSEIYSIIYRLAERGVAVVVVSSELPEVLGICDRIVVMRQGSIVASWPRHQANQEVVLSQALPTGTISTNPGGRERAMN